MTVEGAHTFFVGDKHFLVHNDSCDEITYYHATNDDDAKAIRQNGINLFKVRPNLDFNSARQNGFYVTEDLSQAQKWAIRGARRSGGNPTILKFVLPREELEQLNGKIFDVANKEWGQFVTDARNGRLQHNFDYVEGPMLANPGTGPGRIGSGAAPNPIGSQLAIFSQNAVKVFQRYLR